MPFTLCACAWSVIAVHIPTGNEPTTLEAALPDPLWSTDQGSVVGAFTAGGLRKMSYDPGPGAAEACR